MLCDDPGLEFISAVIVISGINILNSSISLHLLVCRNRHRNLSKRRLRYFKLPTIHLGPSLSRTIVSITPSFKHNIVELILATSGSAIYIDTLSHKDAFLL